MQETNKDSCLEDENKKHRFEQEVRKILHKLTNQVNLKDPFNCDKYIRGEIL